MRYQASTIDHKDVNGAYLKRGDRVIVVSYDKGHPRAADCGTVSYIVGLGTKNVEIFDADNDRRMVNPRCVKLIGSEA